MKFEKKPLRIIDGILDFIGETEDDYVQNYEEIAIGDMRAKPTIETQIISNCCELSIQNYKPENNNKIILDIGCGFGYVIRNVPGKNKFALDISLEQLRQVDMNITKIRANAEDIPIEPESFDIIICTDIFEHVQQENELVSEIYSLLKPEGLLLFASPWEQDLSIYHSKSYKKQFKQYKYMHLRSVDDTILERCFHKFKPIATTIITAHMDSMKLKPYSIKFIQFIRK